MAIDGAKPLHGGLIESPTGGRPRWRVVNGQREYDRLRPRRQALQAPVRIGLEATGTSHRPLVYVRPQPPVSG